MACSGCYIKMIKRDTNTVYQKNAHRLPGSQPVMSLWTVTVVHIHKKYLRTQNIHSIKIFFKDYKNLDKRNFTSQQWFQFCFLMFFFFPFFQSLGDEYPLRFSLSQWVLSLSSCFRDNSIRDDVGCWLHRWTCTCIPIIQWPLLRRNVTVREIITVIFQRKGMICYS